MTKDDVAIVQRINKLPIFCKVCGKELTMSSSVDPITWGCSGMIEGGKYGWVEGRSPADDHYSKSRIYMDFKGWDANQMIRRTLEWVLE